jgi:hypothetical protein
VITVKGEKLEAGSDWLKNASNMFTLLVSEAALAVAESGGIKTSSGCIHVTIDQVTAQAISKNGSKIR